MLFNWPQALITKKKIVMTIFASVLSVVQFSPSSYKHAFRTIIIANTTHIF